jgi:hypothetical protein
LAHYRVYFLSNGASELRQGHNETLAHERKEVAAHASVWSSLADELGLVVGEECRRDCKHVVAISIESSARSRVCGVNDGLIDA